MSVKVNIYNKQKVVKLPTGTRQLIRKACYATLENEGIYEHAEVDVTIVDDCEIKKINAEFRNIDSSTDVLSFPLGIEGDYDVNPENDRLMLGDVIISAEHAKAQADFFGHSLDREIAYLTVHSVFHLLGYDHVDEGENKRIMRKKEEDALSIIGLEII